MTAAARLAYQDALIAVDLVTRGGLSLRIRARAGAVRDALAAHLGQDVLKITPDTDFAAFNPGIDLFASLASGARIERRGLGERLAGRVLLVAGAERAGGMAAAAIAGLIDAGAGVVLLDEGESADDLASMLADRAAMTVDLDAVSIRELDEAERVMADTAGDVPVTLPDDVVAMLCQASMALGIESARVPIAALRVLRALVRRAGRTLPEEADYERVARLVLAPRATMNPVADDAPPPEPEQDEIEGREDGDGEGHASDRDMLVEAACAILPPGLLSATAAGGRGAGAGSADARRGTGARGRSGRLVKGLPVRGSRLDLAATLIAAAPMQRVRGRGPGERIRIARGDIRIRRPLPVRRALTVFAVDASGSAAIARLAEVKGAVERLLGESYVRRDEVALIAFRGVEAETLLPPTRSLARARRELAGLPGGGATPLAAGIIAGLEQAIRGRAAGRAPLLVVLTDGGANIARDGSAGRAGARADAEDAARIVAGTGIDALVIDSSPRGDAHVRALSATMRARYFALPRPDDASLSTVVSGARG